MTYRYVPITAARCGKCKHFIKKYLRSSPTNYQYACEVHGEILPYIVPNFFAEACADFEPKEREVSESEIL